MALAALGWSAVENGLAQNAGDAAPALSALSDPGPATMLFFDDECLYAREKIARKLGQPRRVGAYHETAGNCTWGYPSVFRDAASGRWRMIYQAGIKKANRGGGVVLLAESDDGLQWVRRDTTKDYVIPDRVAPHQIFLSQPINLLSNVFEDLRAAPAVRYKMLTTTPARLWTSPDLVHWTLQEGKNWQAEAPDPPSFVFWNALRRSYQITTRPDHTDRRICLIETEDWETFTAPELVMQADADDPPLAQLYGMQVLPYEGYFIGALWMYHSGSARPTMAPHRYSGGRQDTWLTYSLNGTHWQRCRHEALFANGPAGAPDAGCLQVSSIVPLDDRTLRCYASSSTLEHGLCPPEDGYITAYDLRRDGFVCLEAGEETGLVGTRALYWRGGEVVLNIDASAGAARVRLLTPEGHSITGYAFDDCLPLTGDEVAWTPRWKNGKTLSALAGTMLRCDIELRQARLYALRGDFVLSRLVDVRKFQKEKVIPSRRPGF